MYYDTFIALSDAMSQLAKDEVPESVALLTIARRAVEAACSKLTPEQHTEFYQQLSKIGRDVLFMRDRLDTVINAPMHAGIDKAAKAAAARRAAKRSK